MSQPTPSRKSLPDFSPVNEFIPWTDDDLEQSIPQRFERQVAARSNQPAVRSEGVALTYSELNRQANQIARELLAGSAAANERVALLLPHDNSIIAAILGTLKAGKICVPVAPSFPEARLDRILEDAGATQLLTNGMLAKRIPKNQGGLHIVELEALTSHGEEDAPGCPSNADAVAFIIYTSGSTGHPRGVIQTHRNVLHNIRRHTNGFRYCAADRVSLLASPTSAQGLATALCALLNGATLCPRDLASESVRGLAEWMRAEKITVYVSAASVFRHFVSTVEEPTTFPHLRIVRLASESVRKSDLELFQKHFPPHCLFANTYSSTETGNLCQFFWDQKTPLPGEEVPVGAPADGMTLRLLDENDEPVPRGSVGEIVVQSRYLSPGYWNNAEETRVAFKAQPGGGERLYFTGDLARERPDGLLEHLGRKHHVKVRGFRVYPEEVRRCLCTHPGITDAMVDAIDTAAGDSKLVAHVIPANGSALAAKDLRAFLATLLPEFMVPSEFATVNTFPMTPGGKVDRAALRESAIHANAANSCVSPRTVSEELIAGIFAEVLGRDRVAVDESFFEAGGDSLLVARLSARLEAALKIPIPMPLLFEKATAAALGAALDGHQCTASQTPGPIVSVPRHGPLPLSFSQERNWRQSQSPEGAIGNLLPNGFVLEGALDMEALQRGLNEVVRRHESLRSTFPLVDGEPRQTAGPIQSVPFQYIDLMKHPHGEREADAIWSQEARKPIDLSRGPLLRATLICLTERRHWLLLTYHHIVFDAWARDNLLREVATLYAAYANGRDPALEELKVQYADFAVWQRNLLRRDGPVFQTQLGYWQRQLARAPDKLELPFERPKAPAHLAASKVRWSISSEVSQQLRALGRREGATLFMTRLTAFAAHLHRITGDEDLVIASYIMNRNRPETHNMIGFFSNLVLLRVDVSGNPSYRELLTRIRKITLEATAHADLPFEELRAELERARVRVPKPRLIFEIKYGERMMQFGDVQVRRMDRKSGTMPWRLQFGVEAGGDQTEGQVLFDANRYDPAGIARTADEYIAALAEFAAAPDQRVANSRRKTSPRWWQRFR